MNKTEERDELNLLANILLEQDPRPYQELLNKVMAHDMRLDADELEQAATLLANRKRTLKDEIDRESNAALKTDMQQRLALLERVLERVSEACVMF